MPRYTPASLRRRLEKEERLTARLRDDLNDLLTDVRAMHDTVADANEHIRMAIDALSELT